MWAQLTQNSATLDLYHDLERALRSGGEVALWQTLSRDERVLHPAEMTIQLAAAEAELGNKDESLAILQNLADRRAPELIGINLKPQLQSLQSDPRYNKILANMGLPPVPQR